MMFFFDNAYMLVEGSDIAARLQALSERPGMSAYGMRQMLLSERYR